MASVTYVLCKNGLGFLANCDGENVGTITFVRVGIDKLMIDNTDVLREVPEHQIGLNLVRHVCNLARAQHRKIIAMCPFARAIFNRYSEFDDVRLMYVR